MNGCDQLCLLVSGGRAGWNLVTTSKPGAALNFGRDRDHIKILPGCLVVVGDTAEEARDKRGF